jgi:hypothetical protein
VPEQCERYECTDRVRYVAEIHPVDNPDVVQQILICGTCARRGEMGVWVIRRVLGLWDDRPDASAPPDQGRGQGARPQEGVAVGRRPT